MRDAHTVSDERYGQLRPALELVRLVEDVNATSFFELTIDRSGLPALEPSEPTLSRWVGVASLIVDFDGESTPDQFVVEHAIERGTYRLAVTDRRIVGTFNSALTPKWGAVSIRSDESTDPQVLAFSWPHEAIVNVKLNWEKRALRPLRVTGCNLQAWQPVLAIMALVDALAPADEDWTFAETDSLDDRNFFDFATSVVTAAAQHRLSRGSQDREWLEAMIEGKRLSGDGWECAPLQQGGVTELGYLIPDAE